MPAWNDLFQWSFRRAGIARAPVGEVDPCETGLNCCRGDLCGRPESRNRSSIQEVKLTKGVRWMSWHREAKKDAAACDKLREAGKQALIRRFLNAETQRRLTRRYCSLNV